MIRDFIYFMPIIISIIGVLSIILAIKNKNRINNKLLIAFDIINVIYLFTVSTVIHNILPIMVDLTIIVNGFVSIIGGILYIISSIICICKRKKINDNSENKFIIKLFILIIVIPIIIFISILFREVHLINNSEFILSYHSTGNGGLGDTYDFIYVVSDKYCEETSIDVDIIYEYYYNKMFFTKKLKKITEVELNNKGYEVIIENDYIKVYKNKQLVHKKKLNEKYFNIDLKKVYCNE